MNSKMRDKKEEGKRDFVDLHLEITKKIDTLVEKAEKESSSEDTKINSQEIMANSLKGVVEIRQPFEKKIEMPSSDLNVFLDAKDVKNKPVFENVLNDDKMFEIDLPVEVPPGFRFVTDLNEVKDVIYIRDPSRISDENISSSIVHSKMIKEPEHIHTMESKVFDGNKNNVKNTKQKSYKTSSFRTTGGVNGITKAEKKLEEIKLELEKKKKEIDEVEKKLESDEKELKRKKREKKKREREKERQRKLELKKKKKETKKLERQKKIEERLKERDNKKLEKLALKQKRKEDREKQKMLRFKEKEKLKKQREMERLKLKEQKEKKLHHENIKSELKEKQLGEIADKPDDFVSNEEHIKPKKKFISGVKKKKIKAKSELYEKGLKSGEVPAENREMKENKIVKADEGSKGLLSIGKKKRQISMESSIDEDLIKVLNIADKLLGSLPDEVIDDFVKSDDFELYEKVINKYKIK